MIYACMYLYCHLDLNNEVHTTTYVQMYDRNVNYSRMASPWTGPQIKLIDTIMFATLQANSYFLN